MATATQSQPVLRLGSHIAQWLDVEIDGATHKVPDFHERRVQRYIYAELDAIWTPYQALRDLKSATNLDLQTCLTRMARVILPEVPEGRIKEIAEGELFDLLYATGYLIRASDTSTEGAEGKDPPDQADATGLAMPKPDSPASTAT